MNLAEHMVRAGSDHGAYPAVAEGARVLLRYEALANRVSHIAGALTDKYQLQPGDRVAVIMKNCPAYLEVLYAAWHAGLVVVPINAKLHAKEFAYILSDSGAKFCFVSPELHDTIAALTGTGIACVAPGSTQYTSMLKAPAQAMQSRDDEDAAWLFYTSGTTGLPKGAVLSHKNLATMCDCYFADVDPVEPWSAILHAAPMSHGSGLYGLAYVMRSACHVIPESGKFDPAEVFALIERWPGIAFFAAPTMVNRLVQHPAGADISNLKAIVYGGGPMYVEDCLAALKRFGPKLTQLYGQGESPMTITALSAAIHADTDHPRYLARLASVGTAQSAVEVRIASEDGHWLPPGEVGEILVRGASVMSGYWNKPEATSQTLQNGWLHTGDYGSFDEDGFLTLKDRGKDLIISGGTNIYPREVEEVLLKHPQVAEVAVIGREDREWGEIVVAYIVSADGGSVNAGELDTLCQTAIARFKRPRIYRQIDVLPKNNYGKILKRTLRELDAADP